MLILKWQKNIIKKYDSRDGKKEINVLSRRNRTTRNFHLNIKRSISEEKGGNDVITKHWFPNCWDMEIFISSNCQRMIANFVVSHKSKFKYKI